MSYSGIEMINDQELHSLVHPSEATETRWLLEREYDAIKSGELTKAAYVETRLKHRAEVRHQADHDPLTGILNRRGFNHRFVQVLGAQVRRLQEGSCTAITGSLLLADLDGFKTVNNIYGHSIGDSTLVAFAEIATINSGRFGDTLGRYGGDEFIIYLPDTDQNGAISVAERLKTDTRIAFENSFPETELPITVSVGVRQIPQLPEDEIIEKLKTEEDRLGLLKTLTENADIALYHAKYLGRNKVVVYKTGMTMPKSGLAT